MLHSLLQPQVVVPGEQVLVGGKATHLIPNGSGEGEVSAKGEVRPSRLHGSDSALSQPSGFKPLHAVKQAVVLFLHRKAKSHMNVPVTRCTAGHFDQPRGVPWGAVGVKGDNDLALGCTDRDLKRLLLGG